MIAGMLISFPVCLVLFTLIIFFLSYEYLVLLEYPGKRAFWVSMFISGIYIFISYIDYIPGKYISIIIISLFTLLAFRELFVPKTKSLLINIPVMGMTYLLVPFYLLMKVSDKGFGIHILYFFIIVWASDTMAYFCGRAFGKNKLWPSISPKKTIEGFIGGLIGGLVFAFIFNFFIEIYNTTILVLSSISITVFSMYGDLVESKFKRNLDVKESGIILPGHGGVLDRFDGALLSAPIYFLIIRYLHF